MAKLLEVLQSLWGQSKPSLPPGALDSILFTPLRRLGQLTNLNGLQYLCGQLKSRDPCMYMWWKEK